MLQGWPEIVADLTFPLLEVVSHDLLAECSAPKLVRPVPGNHAPTSSSTQRYRADPCFASDHLASSQSRIRLSRAPSRHPTDTRDLPLIATRRTGTLAWRSKFSRTPNRQTDN